MDTGRAIAVLILFLAALTWFFTGCSSLPAAIEAAGKDHANLCATYVGLYGRITLSRSNVAKGTLTCNADGHRLAPE